MSHNDHFLKGAIKKIALKSNNKRRKNVDEKGNYVRPEVTEQDKISQSLSKIKKRLEDFEEIDMDNYSYIRPGTFIRYLKKLPNGRVKYCHGGMLAINAAPLYWVLKNKLTSGKSISWSVQLNGENMFYCKEGSALPENSIKEICEMVMSQEYKLIKTELLLKLPKDMLLKLIDDNDTERVNTKIIRGRNNSDESNSDEDDESTTLDSEDDSDEARRPTTVVELI
jgi:hypothetical protein